MRPAIVLLSGGLDSTTTLAIAKSEGFTPYALSFNYGQRHQAEIEAAKQIAANAGVTQHVIAEIDLRFFGCQHNEATIERHVDLGPEHADQATELVRRAGVAPRPQHLVEPGRA